MTVSVYSKPSDRHSCYQPSVFSCLSDRFSRAGTVVAAVMDAGSPATVINIYIAARHNLQTGDIIDLTATAGYGTHDGIWQITVIDAYNFTLDGGTYSYGASVGVDYIDINYLRNFKLKFEVVVGSTVIGTKWIQDDGNEYFKINASSILRDYMLAQTDVWKLASGVIKTEETCPDRCVSYFVRVYEYFYNGAGVYDDTPTSPQTIKNAESPVSDFIAYPIIINVNEDDGTGIVDWVMSTTDSTKLFLTDRPRVSNVYNDDVIQLHYVPHLGAAGGSPISLFPEVTLKTNLGDSTVVYTPDTPLYKRGILQLDIALLIAYGLALSPSRITNWIQVRMVNTDGTQRSEEFHFNIITPVTNGKKRFCFYSLNQRSGIDDITVIGALNSGDIIESIEMVKSRPLTGATIRDVGRKVNKKTISRECFMTTRFSDYAQYLDYVYQLFTSPKVWIQDKSLATFDPLPIIILNKEISMKQLEYNQITIKFVYANELMTLNG